MKPSQIDKPKRPALRWHGGKWRLAKWIISYMTTQHDVYVEPFAGSAAVLLNKPRSLIEVYNDKDKELYNYFKVLRNSPNELINAIKYTPYHTMEYDIAWAERKKGQVISPIEMARQFYVRSFMSMLGPTASWSNAFRRQKKYSRGSSGNSSMKPAAISFSETSHLYVIADRLRGVTMENMTALKCIDLYDSPETLFYMDPPYLESTRQHKLDDAYTHEMMTERVHTSFLCQVTELVSMSLISHYKCELYDDHLLGAGWTIYEKEARTNRGGKRKEGLYINPRALEGMRTQ